MESVQPQTVVKGQLNLESEEIHIMYLNSFLLLLVYNRAHESTKALKYLDQSYECGITFKEHLDKICQKDHVASELLLNYTLHILFLIASCYMQ